MPLPPEDMPDTPRTPPPPSRVTADQVTADQERERRRTQRMVDASSPRRASDQRLAKVITQSVTPVVDTPSYAAMSVALPGGWWATELSVIGDWDDIIVGADGQADLAEGFWVGHRPDPASSQTIGHTPPLALTDVTLSPFVIVSGTGSGSVAVVVRLDSCEAP